MKLSAFNTRTEFAQIGDYVEAAMFGRLVIGQHVMIHGLRARFAGIVRERPVTIWHGAGFRRKGLQTLKVNAAHNCY